MNTLLPGAVGLIAVLALGALIIRLLLTVEIRRLEEERRWQTERADGTGTFADVYDWAEEHDL